MGSTSVTAAYLVDAFSECITQSLAAGEKVKSAQQKIASSSHRRLIAGLNLPLQHPPRIFRRQFAYSGDRDH
jgi:hypothetical protein